MKKLLALLFSALLFAGCASTPSSQPQLLFGIDVTGQTQYPACEFDIDAIDEDNFTVDNPCTQNKGDGIAIYIAKKDLPEGIDQAVAFIDVDEMEGSAFFIFGEDSDFNSIKAHLSEKYTLVAQPDPALGLANNNTLWSFNYQDKEWYVVMEEGGKIPGIVIAQKELFLQSEDELESDPDA